MNTKEMIEVMQAHIDGKEIEQMPFRSLAPWEHFAGVWDWRNMVFRIAPEPKKEGRWERVEIEIKDGWYRLRQDIDGIKVVDALHRIPGFGGIDYQSPFNPGAIVRSMMPVMFDTESCYSIGGLYEYCGLYEYYRPGIPVAAWFWREGEK